MEFAVNYSPVLAELVREGRVRVDRFKCPSWPDLLIEAKKTLPVYIHFPLGVGNGLGMPLDSETHQPADLDIFAEMLDQTGTPLINTHFVPSASHYADISHDSRSRRDIERVVSNTLRDLEPLIQRFGAERVTVENICNEWGYLTLAVLPEVIARVLDETGCGFLFDISHARLAARNLGVDERAYCASLPVERIREVHVTGIQVLEGAMLEKLESTGHSNGWIGGMAGKTIDHLPMTGADWPELEWLIRQIQQAKWPAPWVVAYEFGGVGGFWEVLSQRGTYLDELPRMEKIIHSG